MSAVFAARVEDGPELRALVELVLSNPAALAAMPEEQRAPRWRAELAGRIAAGEVAAYVPFLPAGGGHVAVPQGLYWADLCGAGVAFGHQFLLPEAKKRWLNAVACLKACARALLDDYPDVSLVCGLTPQENAAALAAARRAGFEDRGPVDVRGRVHRLVAADRRSLQKEGGYGR